MLDLGVILPIGAENLTDMEGKKFIGTLQYASPEFLFRREENTSEGWRATTFYQLGAVLHDLLMRKPIFEEFCEPYACLVQAVKEEVPIIQTASSEKALADLANRCLLKDPKTRLKAVSWSDFEFADVAYDADQLHDRIRRKSVAFSEAVLKNRPIESKAKIRKIIHEIQEKARDAVIATKLLPPFEIIEPDLNISWTGFGIDFPPSAKVGLGCHLLFRFTVKIEDAATGVSTISAVCGCAKRRVKMEELANETETTIYCGVYSAPQFTQKLNHFLLERFHQAQSLEIVDDGVCYLSKKGGG